MASAGTGVMGAGVVAAGGWRRAGALLWAGLALLVLLLPLFAGRFQQYLALNILLLALLALSFNLLFGMTGLLSFGQAAFYAAGAYTTGLLLRADALPLLPAVLAGALAAGVLAAVIGVFCVRHTHIYFSMLTLAFGMLVYAVVWKWTDVTGGDDGLIGIPRGRLGLPGPLDANLNPLPHYYWFTAVLVLASMYAMARLSASPFGLVLRGIRENPERVEFAGVPVRRYVLLAFVVAGFFAGLAGALVAPLEQTVAPASAHWTKSAEPVMATLLGGPFTFAGPIVGAALYIGLKELIVRVTSYWLLIFGLVLLTLVLTFRGGLVGALLVLAARRRVAAAGGREPAGASVAPISGDKLTGGAGTLSASIPAGKPAGDPRRERVPGSPAPAAPDPLEPGGGSTSFRFPPDNLPGKSALPHEKRTGGA